jgi:hypothetical protein
MIGITALQARYTEYSPDNSEEFSSASRSVKPGLIASGIVSAWTWAATLVRLITFATSQRSPTTCASSKVVLSHTNMVSGGCVWKRYKANV